MGQIAFAISSVPETPIVQVFDVKQHSMKRVQDKSLGRLQLVMMRLYHVFFGMGEIGFLQKHPADCFSQVPL
jgi:hypothetical protein